MPPRQQQLLNAMGLRFILSGLDRLFLMRGAKERSEFLHGLKL